MLEHLEDPQPIEARIAQNAGRDVPLDDVHVCAREQLFGERVDRVRHIHAHEVGSGIGKVLGEVPRPGPHLQHVLPAEVRGPGEAERAHLVGEAVGVLVVGPV